MKNTIKFKSGLSRYWWLPLVVGLICIGLGVWLMFQPAIVMPVLAYTFAAFIILTGIIDLVYASVAWGPGSNWGWSLACGLLELILGIWMCCMPEAQLTIAFMYVVGFWMLFVAINAICESAAFSTIDPSWIIWFILGLIAVIGLTIVFLTSPLSGGVVVWIYLGCSFIIYGIYRVALAFKIKKLNRITDGVL